MRRFLKAIDATSEWTGKVIGYAMYPAIAVLIWEIVLRHIFDAPTIWAHGISQRLFAAYYVLAGAYVLRFKEHVRMDLIYNLFPPRTRVIMDLLTFPFFFAFCAVLLWYGGHLAWKSLLLLEPDQTPFNAPLYPVKLMIPLGAFLILLQGLAKFSRDLITAITGRQGEY